MTTVRLRPVRFDDLPALGDPSLHEEPFLFFGFVAANGLERRFAADGLISEDSGLLAVEDADGTLIGSVGWYAVRHGPSPTARALNVGIELLAQHRGRGHGTAAQAAFADYLFSFTVVERLEAGTDIDNVAEQRALEKSGFQREGVLRHAQYRDGRWRDLVLFSRLRDDPAPHDMSLPAVSRASDTSKDLRSVLDMVLGLARDRSTEILAVPGGQALLNADFPAAHSMNKIVVTDHCEPGALADAAESIFGERGLEHRLIEVHDLALGARLEDALRARGYESGRALLMVATPQLRRPVGPAEVVELDLDERISAARAGWRLERPEWDDTVVDQLARRIETVLVGARPLFFAVRDETGAVVARADLYLRAGVGQVEEVITDPAHRGRGLASTLVCHATARARAEGAGLVFLDTDADDRPQDLYRRLGFADLATTMTFTRPTG